MLRKYGAKVRYPDSKPRRAALAIAWGNRTMPRWGSKMKWINNPLSIPLMADKRDWAALCEKEGFGPEFTTDKVTAAGWITDGHMVLCRTMLNASGGKGIVGAREQAELVPAPLYTKYFRKTCEYRVVYSPSLGQPIVYGWSKRRPADFDGGPDDMLIRTLDRGFVYQWEDKLPIPVMGEVARVAEPLAKLGLHMLAYDIAYNSKKKKALVIEANTAWGLNEDTGELTVKAMRELGDMI